LEDSRKFKKIQNFDKKVLADRFLQHLEADLGGRWLWFMVKYVPPLSVFSPLCWETALIDYQTSLLSVVDVI